MKNKVIGILLIALGAWPFVLKIESVASFFSSYTFLEMLTPGEVVYQIALIVLGALLVWSVRARVQPAQ